MTPSALFAVANSVALFTWIVLIVFQRRNWARQVVVPVVVTLFAGAYTAIVALHWGTSTGGFGSLAEVARLFSNPWMLLAGWIHYLAFDLLVGRWIAADAASTRLSPWLAAPCMALTFMFGPAGWLAYIALTRARLMRIADR